MHRCDRGEAPASLARVTREIGDAYAARRADDGAARFRWPQRGGERIYDVARDALALMTSGRCSYCDGYPIDDRGQEEIDHFRPKNRPEFYALVCEWTNLFLACSACNGAKLGQWDELLLRPDDTDYAAARYFVFDARSGELDANPRASNDDRRRALRSIEIFGLNRNGACISRRKAWRAMASDPSEVDDRAYRFLNDLAAGVPG